MYHAQKAAQEQVQVFEARDRKRSAMALHWTYNVRKMIYDCTFFIKEIFPLFFTLFLLLCEKALFEHIID